MANETDNSSQRRTKVARLIDEHGFGDIGIELERRWTAEGDERMSLRDLADYLNRRLLATAMEEHGMQPLDGEVENVYRLLTANDVSDADRTRVRRRLEREVLTSTRYPTTSSLIRPSGHTSGRTAVRRTRPATGTGRLSKRITSSSSRAACRRSWRAR
jgi:hypothetical protein